MINVVLTLDELQEADACEAGLEYFKENFGDTLVVGNWTEFHSLYCSTSDDADFFEWLVNQGLFPATRVIGSKLIGFDLESATLRNSSFFSSIFKDCSFSGAALECSRIHNTSFGGCNFRGSMLFNSFLDSCVFTECDLSRADFRRVNLRNSVFRRCNLKEASFCDASFEGAYFDEDCILTDDDDTILPLFHR